MSFEEDKKRTLTEKKDMSKAGGIDKQIVPLIDLINSKGDFYTTSSCAGRVLIFEKTEDAKKNQVNWLLSSHEPVEMNQVKEVLKDLKLDVWFAFQPLIMHVRARDLKNAHSLIQLAREVGLKRGGVISLEEKPLVEIQGVDEIATIIAKNGKLIIDDDYLNTLIDQANKKMAKNSERSNRLRELISSNL